MGLVALGATRVEMPFSGFARTFGGVVKEFCRPWFKVFFDDGDRADYAGHEMARHIVFPERDFFDPRLWYYDFSVLHPADVPGWRSACSAFCNSFGIELPTAWLGTEISKKRSAERAFDDSAEEFRRREQAALRDAHVDMMGGARERRTIANLRNPGLKLVWWCASRGHHFPPTAAQIALYYTKLAKDQDNIGAVSAAKSSFSFICAYNDLPTSEYSSLRVNAALETMRRKHKHQVKKAAGLTVGMVRAIMDEFGSPLPHLEAKRQWRLAVGASIALGFKLLLRYDDLKRCRWDPGYCEVFPTHIRFYLDGRKNNMYGGDFLDVAAPAVPEEFGVYHICLLARSVFRSGFVLAYIGPRGDVDSLRAMPHASFIRHLREALHHIGLSRDAAAVFSAHSMRSGGATAAAVHGLHREDIQHLAGVKDVNWLAYYNRMYLAERLRVSQSIGL